MESMQDVHSSAPSAIRLERADLGLVLAVFESGGVTRAGSLLHLSQSALSRRLLDLEARVGAPLFRRAGRRMTPTALGEEICRRAVEVERSFVQAEASLRRGVRGGRRIVRVTTECYTAYHWLEAVLGPLKLEFPEVEVRLALEATREPELALRAGRVDAAIVSEALTISSTGKRAAKIRYEGLRSWHLFDDELVVALAPEHPLAGKKFLRAEDLRKEHVLVYDARQESALLGLLIPAGVRPEQMSTVPLTEATIALVKAGTGVGVLARWVLTQHLAAGTVRALTLSAHGLRRSWNMVALETEADDTETFIPRFAELLRARGPG
jgi:LysR family transcriptional regulator, regulator for metE and metH